MKRYLVFAALVALTCSCAHAQKARIGGLPNSALIVTNEQDTAALAALAASGSLWRAEWQAAAGASSEVVRAELTASGTLWRTEWQGAAGASADVVRAALASSGTAWRVEWQAAAGSSSAVVRAELGAGMGALTSSVSTAQSTANAANTTGATHTAQIAALGPLATNALTTAQAGCTTGGTALAAAAGAQATANAANTTGATHTVQLAALGLHAAGQTNVNHAVASGLSTLTGAINGVVADISTNEAFCQNAAEAGRTWGGRLTVDGGSRLDIAAGGGRVKNGTGGLSSIPTSETNGQGAPLTYVSWPATNLTLLAGYNIVFWDASEGYLTNCLKANMSAAFDFVSDFTIGRVWYDSAYGPVARLCGMNRWNKDRRQQIFHEQIHPVEVGSGGVVAGSGLQFSVSAAEIWAEGENYFTTIAKGVTTNFVYWWKTNGLWTFVQTTSISNTPYNSTNTASGLTAMLANRWRADYVYLVHDGVAHVVMGQVQHVSQTIAEDAELPVPPEICSAYGTLIARITVQQGASTMTVDTVNRTSFSATATPDHNGLGGLQGGAASEYYHLTASGLMKAQNALTNPAAFDPAGTAGVVQVNLDTHTNLTLAGGAHGGLPTAADIGAMSNTAAAIAAAGGVTGAVFSATGTQPSIAAGLLSIPTNGLGGGATEPTVTNIVLEVGAAQGWSTNTAWTWQGAQIVVAPTNVYTVTYTPPAVWAHNRHELLPYSTTNYGGALTGVVTITMVSNIYLASIGGTMYDANPGGISFANPIRRTAEYATATSAVLSAWCSQDPLDAVSAYYAYFSNLVVYTYDRTGMQAYQYTNDAAGIVARVDPLPSGNTDTRRVVNAESLADAIADAKPDIAKEAWNYTPTGARQPSATTLTIDKTLVQQGQMAYLQSGDYFAASYQGGDWYNVTTGSVWRLGPGGRVAFEVSSTNRMLFIEAFAIATNWATIDIATNWITGAPYVEFTQDLGNLQWLAAPSQIVTSNSTYWRIQCPATATQRFYRAVSPGGANGINSYYQHNFLGGISDGTTTMASRSLYVVTNANGSGCTITGFFGVSP
jgi:hypothetical protein